MLFAIDVDGVLLDYNKAFKKEFDKIFKTNIQLKDSGSFQGENYWHLPEAQWKKEFYRKSGAMWREMPALEGAVEAVNSLVSAGHEVVCVTSMPKEFESARLHNLQRHGFQIYRVIATSRQGSGNPKKPYIDALKPDYFIDDLLKNFDGIDNTELVYIDRNYTDKPNDEWSHIQHHHKFASLLEFADYILSLGKSPKPKVG